jgi:hypothetical protein
MGYLSNIKKKLKRIEKDEQKQASGENSLHDSDTCDCTECCSKRKEQCKVKK